MRAPFPILTVVAALTFPGAVYAADRRAAFCDYSDLATTSYAQGACVMHDLPSVGGKASYAVTWPLGVTSPANLRLVVIVDGQGEGASQTLVLDGQPARGFEMSRGRYLIVNRTLERALVIEAH